MQACDYKIGNRQPQPRADANVFRSEKRLKYAPTHGFFHAWTVVADFDAHVMMFFSYADCDGGRVRSVVSHHGLGCIFHQIQEYLLDFGLVAGNGRQVRLEITMDIDVPEIILFFEVIVVPCQAQDRLHKFGQIHGEKFRAAPPAERKHVGDNLGRAHAVRPDA
ncbi:MAG: hypothetical protein BWX80_03519 [Candidatus Hydrogenedentes bacterium ADurb.Bin101]|nr:MAG: hypothetical protein BWX80_03519 [Candidatus Hydrogenedentes bacterium ADurb.Bin101]